MLGDGPNRRGKKYANLPPLTDAQNEIITGSMLGDGSITFRGKENGHFWKRQKAASREYLEWHIEALAPYSSPELKSQLSKAPDSGDKLFPNLRFRTCYHPLFTRMYHEWYPNGRKIVPRAIRLTPLAMAIWFCDDGANAFRQGIAHLCTQGFSLDDVLFLINRLEFDLGIKSSLRPRLGNKYHEILIPTISYLPMMKMISPFITWQCFQYKIAVTEKNATRIPLRKLHSWEFIDPAGNHHSTEYLTEFCNVFGLSQKHMSTVASGKRKMHKGWTAAKVH